MSKKILLSDDDRDLVYALQIRLEKDGYKVLVSYNGQECLDMAQKEHPDLIIMDVSMPKLDGFTVVRAIKAEEAISQTPIIILTGKDHMEDIFRMEGVKEYIVKPFEYEVLAENILKIFGKSDG